MKFEKSAGLILFKNEKNNREYLLLENNGKWGFPKGNINENESELNAALRECEEETGIKKLKIIPGFKKNEDYIYKDIYTGSNELVKKNVVYYLAETNEQKITISFEHQNYAWLTHEKAETKLKTKNIKKILEEAEKYLKEKPTLEKWS